MTMATNMNRMMKFADAFPVAEIVSTLSAKSLCRMLQFVLPFPQFVATPSRQLSGSRFVNLPPTLRDKEFAIADHLGQAHQEGHAWGDMAILCADWKTMALCADALAQRKLPFNVRKRSGDFNPGANAIQVMTMKVSKGLEFPVVALPGMGHMPAAGEDEKEAARVFYVAATRATQKLVVGIGGSSPQAFTQKLAVLLQ